MNEWDLRIFEAVARTGGLGRAAAELNTVQSNVTTRMRRLEEELETELFDRHSRGVTLTAAGHRLRPYAVQILSLFDQANRATRDTGVPRGTLNLGSLETTAALRMPPTLTTFTQRYPDVDVHLHTGATAPLIADVLERRLDGAFVTGPVTHPDLASECVFIEELAIAAPAAVATIDDIWALPDLRIVVFRHGCSYRRRLENLLASRGVSGVRILQFGSLEAILECVAAGVGVTLLPIAVLSGPIRPQSTNDRTFSIHRLAPAESYAETLFIRRAECHLSSAMAEFLSIARAAQEPASVMAKPGAMSASGTQRAA